MGLIIRQSIKGTIVNYIGTAIGMVTIFFIVPKYLNNLEVFGLMRTLVDAGVVFVSLAQIGTNASILRFYPYFKDPENKDNGFFFWTLIIPIVGFCIYLFAFIIFKNLICVFYIEKSILFVNYIYFILPLGFFMLYQTVFETNSVVLLRIVVPAFVREVGVRFMVMASYLLFSFHFISLTGLVIAFCCTYGIAACINLGYLFHLGKISLKPNFKHIKNPLKKDFLFFALFLMGSALTTAIVPMLGTFFIGAKLGLAFAGIYAFARHIIAFIEIPYRSLGAISNPHISQTVKEKNFVATNHFIKKVSLHQFLIGSAIFFLIWTNIDLIFNIIPNGYIYAPGKWVVLILGLSTILNTSLSVVSSTLGYSKYYYYSLIFTFILTGSAIVMNVICIPIWGLNGAAFATLFSSSFYILLLLCLVQWKLKVNPLSWGHLKILFITILLFGLNNLWNQYLTTLIFQYIYPTFGLQICEAAVRTLVLEAIGLLCVYFWHISEEVNALVGKLGSNIFLHLNNT